MDFGLASELRDAGFPQTWREGKSFYDIKGTFVEMGCSEYNHDLAAKNGVMVPNLEELIKACGANFDRLNLSPNSGKWFAVGWKAKEIISEGAISIEAVARLYLALNRTESAKS